MKHFTLASFFVIVGVLSIFSILYGIPQQLFSASHAPFEAPAELPDVVGAVIEARQAAIVEEGNAVPFGDEGQINVLLIGLDARKGWDSPHCDAIHMLSLDIENWTMQITSVPRGTYAYIPPGTYGETQYYLANACALAGLDYGIERIEAVVGVRSDYVVTVGFSQVLGILRIFDLPTTEGLQWLRHRQSYAIGDPQRSHNQAVFMKDLVLGHLSKFRGLFSVPMEYLLYTIVDTDMDFATSRALLNGFLDASIDARPDDIALTMKPWYATVDYHFDAENSEAQLDERLDIIRPFLSDEDLSGRTLSSVQGELIMYLENVLVTGKYEQALDQQLWLQVEDADMRESLHYQFVVAHYLDLLVIDEEEAIIYLTDYILETQIFGLSDYEHMARELLEEAVYKEEELSEEFAVAE